MAADHFLRGVFWPRSVYGIATASPWRWAEHAGWVIFEDVVLIRGCLQSCGELREIALRQAELAAAHAKVEQTVQERTAELCRANEELTRQAAELRESQALMASIVETAPDAIVTIDHLSRVVEFNPAAEGIFGYSKGEVVGRRLAELILPPTQCHDDPDTMVEYLKHGSEPILGPPSRGDVVPCGWDRVPRRDDFQSGQPRRASRRCLSASSATSPRASRPRSRFARRRRPRGRPAGPRASFWPT